MPGRVSTSVGSFDLPEGWTVSNTRAHPDELATGGGGDPFMGVTVWRDGQVSQLFPRFVTRNGTYSSHAVRDLKSSPLVNTVVARGDDHERSIAGAQGMIFTLDVVDSGGSPIVRKCIYFQAGKGWFGKSTFFISVQGPVSSEAAVTAAIDAIVGSWRFG